LANHIPTLVRKELLGTGLARRQRFLKQALEFREALRAFLRERDAADGESSHVLFLFALWAANRADVTGYAMAEES